MEGFGAGALDRMEQEGARLPEVLGFYREPQLHVLYHMGRSNIKLSSLFGDWVDVATRVLAIKSAGSLWHAYRRLWATERKHLPVQDVALAGGWTNPVTLQMIYQQPDEATLNRVISEPVELREAK